MTTIDIVGGGIMGLVLGYDLLKRGVGVRIWERATELGGLMGRIRFPELSDVEVDRYYHAILNSDRTLIGLIDELGLTDELHAVTTKMGFYHNGDMFPMSSPLDFMRFPPLSMIDRARLATTILAARRVKNWRELEQIPVIDWLTRLGGKGTVEHIWKPLLRAKFDTSFDNVPATYIWSRLVRMTDTRDKSTAKEQMCFLTGGYIMLIQALAREITRLGGEIHLGTSIQKVCVEDNRVTGLQLADGRVASDGVILTLQTPIACRLLPSEAAATAERWSALEEYLGIVCMLLVMRRSLIPYYTLNITDASIPFTGVIETTNLIDRQYTDDYHLVYLPKYVTPGSVFAQMDDETLRQKFMGYLRKMFPDLQDNDIAAIRIGRERYVEPLHPLGQTDAIPPIAADTAGLYLVNNSQIYPQLTNGEAVITYAYRAAEEVVQSQQRINKPVATLVAA
ncbi:MAG: NAD(P)/FAD-dependent oxidoreductase [Chloroflexi bacterium AL-W]|nr:NAD(P)/FAD-dependent oxidoreductase [Chloroflexi bacterium AL-N1]NOK69736.1 NAD(P)/FAD-dependent oxidoreductase [Chloroflexi bacterium AL-N10]NOK73660.1 NAD(P)/FAD-dependent oxidoreductase [Chloroflexi bacterium AL-N5]NOK83906.1 NAD(P)/FAD-dependent oxidoreductase [Chloroflexi bacterium AL-W]NOK87991.1 NAD(P)/FAD-dependent oxidoreductase [Chloroflexi bacterium AL-N15]